MSKTIPKINLTPGPSVSQELIDDIVACDHAFFEAVFITGDLEIIGEFITEDFEFYHDKGGLTATSRAQFVEIMRTSHERQQQGVDFRARRELDKDSLTVYPLNHYGAIQVGIHRFYALVEGKEYQLTETSRFTHVWKEEEGKWRMSRVLSYDHQLAE
jgi:hypothetical protein